MQQMLRPKVAQARTGVGKTKFNDDFVDHGREGEECVPGTDVRRLRPVHLGKRCVAFPEDEVDELIEALKARRDLGDAPAAEPRPRPPAQPPLQRRPIRRRSTPRTRA